MSNLLTKLLTELKANKAKSAVLGVLFLVLVIAFGRLLLPESTPSSVKAASKPSAAGPQAPGPSGDTLLRPTPQTAQGNAPPTSAQKKGAAVSKSSSIHYEREKAVAIDEMPRTLSRDLFTTPAWSKFRENGLEPKKIETKREKGVSSLFEGFATAVRDYQTGKEEQRHHDEQELAQLVLQSTLTGPTPLAYISGRLTHEGDVVRGFSVLRILDRRVILAKSGITHILSMQ